MSPTLLTYVFAGIYSDYSTREIIVGLKTNITERAASGNRDCQTGECSFSEYVKPVRA